MRSLDGMPYFCDQELRKYMSYSVRVGTSSQYRFGQFRMAVSRHSYELVTLFCLS